MPKTEPVEVGAPERPRRLSLSQIVEMLLTRTTGERSAVSLTRNLKGETQIEVKVGTGTDGEVLTVEDAERKAREVYDRLATAYPHANGHDAASVEFTRNAKGETQISVDVKTGEGVATVTDALDAATEAFKTARARFPMADGRVGAYADK